MEYTFPLFQLNGMSRKQAILNSAKYTLFKSTVPIATDFMYEM